MPLFIIYLSLIIISAFLVGLITGSSRKEREYQDIIDAIFKRKYILQGDGGDASPSEDSEFDFMVMKDEKTMKPVFSRQSNNG